MIEYPHVRWLIRRDMAEVLAISNQLVEPWTEEQFLMCLRLRNCIGKVATIGETHHTSGVIVGYMIYELHKHHFELLTMAVDERWRRKGIGFAMMTSLLSKLSPHRRTRIVADVHDGGLDGHLFLKSMGFKAVGVFGDQYRFECRIVDQEDEHLEAIRQRSGAER